MNTNTYSQHNVNNINLINSKNVINNADNKIINEVNELYFEIEDLFESLSKNLVTHNFAANNGTNAENDTNNVNNTNNNVNNKLVSILCEKEREKNKLIYCNEKLNEINSLLNIQEPELNVKKNGISWEIDELFLNQFNLKLDINNRQNLINDKLNNIDKLTISDYYQMFKSNGTGFNYLDQKADNNTNTNAVNGTYKEKLYDDKYEEVDEEGDKNQNYTCKLFNLASTCGQSVCNGNTSNNIITSSNVNNSNEGQTNNTNNYNNKINNYNGHYNHNNTHLHNFNPNNYNFNNNNNSNLVYVRGNIRLKNNKLNAKRQQYQKLQLQQQHNNNNNNSNENYYNGHTAAFQQQEKHLTSQQQHQQQYQQQFLEQQNKLNSQQLLQEKEENDLSNNFNQVANKTQELQHYQLQLEQQEKHLASQQQQYQQQLLEQQNKQNKEKEEEKYEKNYYKFETLDDLIKYESDSYYSNFTGPLPSSAHRPNDNNLDEIYDTIEQLQQNGTATSSNKDKKNRKKDCKHYYYYNICSGKTKRKHHRKKCPHHKMHNQQNKEKEDSENQEQKLQQLFEQQGTFSLEKKVNTEESHAAEVNNNSDGEGDYELSEKTVYRSRVIYPK